MLIDVNILPPLVSFTSSIVLEVGGPTSAGTLAEAYINTEFSFDAYVSKLDVNSP